LSGQEIPNVSLTTIPAELFGRYKIEERHHAVSILSQDFPQEFQDLIGCLNTFQLTRSAVMTPGGGRSPIPQEIDGYLHTRGWAKKKFDIRTVIDGEEIRLPSHEIDNFKNRIGVEVEWNNKTEFYDRDLNNFRLLWERKVISVGVIITRASELQDIFNALGKGSSFGASTTHWNKLIPKVDGGGAGGCPLLLVGIDIGCYSGDR
jgi:hypothetical protein